MMKRSLILIFIILIGVQFPVWGMPHKNEVIDFVNIRFPAQITEGLKRNELILDVFNALNMEFAPRYSPNEGPYQLEAFLTAFGLGFYKDESGKIVFAVENVNKLLEFLRQRIKGKTYSLNVTLALSSIFGLTKHVSKNAKKPDEQSLKFYKDWASYFEFVPLNDEKGYLGFEFFTVTDVTVFYRPIPYVFLQPLSLPVFRGIPLPSNVDNSGSDIVRTLIMDMPLPSSRRARTARKILGSVQPQVLTQNMTPSTHKLFNSIGASSHSNTCPKVLTSMLNALECFKESYENDDKLNDKYDFFTFPDEDLVDPESD